MILYFCYSLTATRIPTFRYINWTPDVALTGSFLDIVFGQYQARDGRKNCHQKRGMSSSSPVFARQSRPWCHVGFVKMRGWSMKSRYL